MPLPKRTLTINFERSVTAGIPNTIEVAVTPLAEPNAPGVATLVGGVQSQTVVVDNEVNPVVFELVPTDSPALSERILYRIAWRQRYLGRQYVKDFVMPDVDCTFDELEDLGNIIGGETYVQWTDRSAPGGVAGLNSLGQVIDADGNPVITDGPTLAQSLTASRGVQKVTTTVDGGNVYDFRLDTAVAARRWSGPVIPASGSFGVINHNLGTTAVVLAVYRTDTRDAVTPVGWRPSFDGNSVSIMFAAAPTSGEYYAVVVG